MYVLIWKTNRSFLVHHNCVLFRKLNYSLSFELLFLYSISKCTGSSVNKWRGCSLFAFRWWEENGWKTKYVNTPVKRLKLRRIMIRVELVDILCHPFTPSLWMINFILISFNDRIETKTQKCAGDLNHGKIKIMECEGYD